MTAAAGVRYGRLVCVEVVGSTRQRHALWLCRCDCGADKTVSARSLQKGDARSCGCLRRERLAEANKLRAAGLTKKKPVEAPEPVKKLPVRHYRIEDMRAGR